MTILLSKSLLLSSYMLVLIVLILSETLESVHSGVDTNPSDSRYEFDPYYFSGDGLGLFDPLYDSNNQNSPTCESPTPPSELPIYNVDIMQLQFAQNLEHLEAEYYLWGALGYGLDKVAPQLVFGGPPPIGVRKANLDNLTKSIITEFGYHEVGHLRVLKSTVGGISRPLLDLSPKNFATIVNRAFEHDLKPSFDPYRDSLSYMLATYIIPYVGLNGYVGANPLIRGYVSKRLLAGLLGAEGGQDAVVRTYLFERRNEIVHPYNFTVAEFTNRISILRNRLGMCGLKDEGLVVPPELGAEGRISTNVLSLNRDSIAYARTTAEVLRVLYVTGSEHIPGGFYPKGANGEIAKMYLKKHH